MQRAALLVLVLFASPATAQEGDPRTAAKAHFDAGNGLLARGETEAALAEFQLSRALFPTRGNSLNTAIALQRLGRFDEALEVYLTLPRDFVLDAADRARVEREIELLHGLTGTLKVHAESGSAVSIDGRDRGIAPFGKPFIVLAGKHTVRAVKAGQPALEKRVEIVTGAEQQVTLDASCAITAEAPSGSPATPPPSTPAVAPPTPPASSAASKPSNPPQRARDPASATPVVLGLDLGPFLAASLGGPLAEACNADCQAKVPLGFGGRLRAGYRVKGALELGLELGYLTLSARYERRSDTLEPKGSGQQPGTADDDLGWSATRLGGYAGWRSEARVHLRASLGAGVAFNRMSDTRHGQYEVSPASGEPYLANVRASQVFHGSSLYFEPELGVGITLGTHVELAFGLGAAVVVPLSSLRFDASQGVVVKNAEGRAELAYFQSDELTGKPFFLVTPHLGTSVRF